MEEYYAFKMDLKEISYEVMKCIQPVMETI